MGISTDSTGKSLNASFRGDVQEVVSVTSGTPFKIDCTNLIGISFSTVASKEIFFTRHDIYGANYGEFLPTRCMKIPGKGSIIDVSSIKCAQIVLNIPSGTDTIYMEKMLQDEGQGA